MKIEFQQLNEKDISCEEKSIKGSTYTIKIENNLIGSICLWNNNDFIGSKEKFLKSLGIMLLSIKEQKILENIKQIIEEFINSIVAEKFKYISTQVDAKDLMIIKSFEKAGFYIIRRDENVFIMIKLIHNQFRLSDIDLIKIEGLFKEYFLDNDKLYIFGSRVDKSKKGGDIDLYIETHMNANDADNQRKRFWGELQNTLGEQKIDIVLNIINDNFHIPIYTVAKTEGIQFI